MKIVKNFGRKLLKFHVINFRKQFISLRQPQYRQLLLDLFRAYFDARKNKRSTANVLAFENGYEEKLFRLYQDIISRKYEIGRSICFIVNKPVKREIFAADFRDRIVHHLIFNYINPIFEKHFIKDSYSCRLGKGTSEGIRRAAHFIRSCSENYQKDCWILKLDITGYFMAMDLTSQLFGNIYLDDFDHFARQKIAIKSYGRYVDDMLFVHSDKRFLKSAILEIREYLRNNLELILHPQKIYLQHFSKGVAR